MDTMEIVYYTCRNSDCPKHRNVFVEGDPQHAKCDRERLFLENESRGPQWMWFALPAAIALAATAFYLWRRMAETPPQQQPRMLHEERPQQTWSGSHTHLDERHGSAVPPPIK